MSRKCSVCYSTYRSVVDSGLALGQPAAELAERTGLNPAAISRHSKKHFSMPVADGSDHGKQLDLWLSRIDQTFLSCGVTADLRGQLEAIRSALALLERRQLLEAQRTEREGAEPVWLGDQLNGRAYFRDLTVRDFDRILQASADPEVSFADVQEMWLDPSKIPPEI